MAGTIVVARDVADSRSSENLKDVDMASRGIGESLRARR
jgi:tartrate dehydratase beta subunit/fumarate hydratase class I family protein